MELMKQIMATKFNKQTPHQIEGFSDLPFIYTTSKEQQFRFDWLTEAALPALYEIIQRIGKEAEGIEPEVFYPLDNLRNTMLPLIRNKQAFGSKYFQKNNRFFLLC